jgi:hypothetical protein
MNPELEAEYRLGSVRLCLFVRNKWVRLKKDEPWSVKSIPTYACLCRKDDCWVVVRVVSGQNRANTLRNTALNLGIDVREYPIGLPTSGVRRGSRMYVFTAP